jgi:hypothetical protein
MATWKEIHNKYFMLHWCFDWHFSLRRKTGKDKIIYGPYIDIHFLWYIFSIGYQPYWGTFNQ